MSDPRPAPRREIRGWAVALGILVPLPLAIAALSVGPRGWGIAAAGVVAALVLVTRDDPVRRGLGSGLLIGGATIVLLFGSCVAILSKMDI